MPHTADGARPRLEVFVLPGIGEVRAGDDLTAVILAVAGPAASRLADGDILAVTSKIVSKAEGRQVAAGDREQAITDETVRVVATRAHPGGVTRIVENRQGLVMAAAGVDASNVAEGIVLLLPADPDASARALCIALRAATGLQLGVLITDTVGRPWRDGQTDIAIGAAGVTVLDDLRGTTDAHGRRLDVTVAAVADEIAGTADLIKGKTSGNPVAVVRGLGRLVGPVDPEDNGARRLLRDSEKDMFRVGSAEAYAEGYAAGLAAAAAAGAAARAGGPGAAPSAAPAASGAPTEQGAADAPSPAQVPGMTRAAEDDSGTAELPGRFASAHPTGHSAAPDEIPVADLPQSSPSGLPKGDFAATREISDADLPQSSPSAPAKGASAAIRDSGGEVPGAELPVVASSGLGNGPQVATRGSQGAEFPVVASSERINGPQVATRGTTSP